MIALAGVLFVGSLTGVFTASRRRGCLAGTRDSGARAPDPESRIPNPEPRIPSPESESRPAGQLATMQRSCVSCHNDRTKVAGVSLQGITPESIGQQADVFEKAVRKMRGRVMPPPGARQPDGVVLDSLVA